MIAITQLVKLQLLEQNAILKIKFQLRLWRKSHNSKKYSCNFRKVTIVRYKVKIKTRLQWREIKLQLWKSCNCYSHNLISHNCDFFHDCNIIMKNKMAIVRHEFTIERLRVYCYIFFFPQTNTVSITDSSCKSQSRFLNLQNVCSEVIKAGIIIFSEQSDNKTTHSSLLEPYGQTKWGSY